MSFKLKVVGLILQLYTAELAIAQQTPPSGLACALDVPIPGYRGVFWFARVVGEAKAILTIGPGGTTVSVDVQSKQPALVAWLKPALLASAFLGRCAGETVEINFIYRITGGEEAEPRNEFRLKGPNTFEVIARPPISNVQP